MIIVGSPRHCAGHDDVSCLMVSDGFFGLDHFLAILLYPAISLPLRRLFKPLSTEFVDKFLVATSRHVNRDRRFSYRPIHARGFKYEAPEILLCENSQLGASGAFSGGCTFMMRIDRFSLVDGCSQAKQMGNVSGIVTALNIKTGRWRFT